MARDALARSAEDVIEKLVAQKDPDLAGELLRLLKAGQFRYNARPIIRLLGQLDRPESEEALRFCLSLSDLDAVAAALGALHRYLRPDDAPQLSAFLRTSDHAVRAAALVAAGHLRERTLAEPVAECLASDTAEERIQAAITLGALGDPSYAHRLVERLEDETDRAHAAFTAALEMLGNREVVPRLVELLRLAPDQKVWDLAHALWLLTGVDPVADENGSEGRTSSRLRRAWLDAANTGVLAAPPPPTIVGIRGAGTSVATFDVAFGRGLVRIDYDPPTPGSTWPRWSRSLLVGTKRTYEVGSTCGTCDLLLRHVSWPAESLSATARQLEGSGLAGGLDAWISAWAPVLEQLRSGRYLVASLAIRLERIDEATFASSWFNRRYQERLAAEPEEGESEAVEQAPWLGTSHFQGPRVGKVPTYPVVMPLQELKDLDEGRIAHFKELLARGDCPPAVALSWLDAREVRGTLDERFLVMNILNGHHRIEACVRSGVPTPIIAVARVADSWGPSEDPEKYLRDAWEPFIRK